MWNAIKSDLLDFVATIQEDTTKIINKAAGEVDEEEEIQTLRQKLLQDVKRNFDTFGTPIEDQHGKEFEKFMRSFSLSSQAAEIAQLLDDEPDVSRYYADLVPISISPELFWARYFFRLILVSRGGVVNLDDEEEEDLAWESTASPSSSEAVEGSAKGPTKSSSDRELVSRIKQLEDENSQLKSHIRALVARVTELEAATMAVSMAEVPTTTSEMFLSSSSSIPAEEAPSEQQAVVQAETKTVAEASVEKSSAGTPAVDRTGSKSGDDTVIVDKQPLPPPQNAAPSMSAIPAAPLPPATRLPQVKSLVNLDEDEDEDWG